MTVGTVRAVVLVFLSLALVVVMILAATSGVEQKVRAAVHGEPTPARIEERP